MDEYISKETLQDKLSRKKAGPATKRYTEGWNDAILMVKSMIHGEQAADVAPVRHGRWVNERMLVGGFAETWACDCSVCGRTQREPLWKPNYCPNCGARMDLEG